MPTGAAIAKAGELLAARFSAASRIVDVAAVDYVSARNRAARCGVERVDDLLTVIVKETKDVQADDLRGRAPATRLALEMAALAFLEGLGLEPRLSPRLWAANYESGVQVVEDLGQGESLLTRLLGNDAAAARDGLVQYGRSLGRMHAAGIGRYDEYSRLLSRHGPRSSLDNWGAQVGHDAARFWDSLGFLGLEPSEEACGDLERAAVSMTQPGRFLTFAHGDGCPGNDRIIDGRLVFFDFEFAGFRHAFYDGAYLEVPFPTCGYSNRIPGAVKAEAQAAYRSELAAAAPEVLDDGIFNGLMVEACAYLLTWTAVTLMAQANPEDHDWGNATYRQRFIQRFEDFGNLALAKGCLPAMGEHALKVAVRMREVWGLVPDMPLYPAFQEEDP